MFGHGPVYPNFMGQVAKKKKKTKLNLDVRNVFAGSHDEEEEEEEGCCTSYGFPKTLTCQARVYNNEECSED